MRASCLINKSFFSSSDEYRKLFPENFRRFSEELSEDELSVSSVSYAIYLFNFEEVFTLSGNSQCDSLLTKPE